MAFGRVVDAQPDRGGDDEVDSAACGDGSSDDRRLRCHGLLQGLQVLQGDEGREGPSSCSSTGAAKV